MKYTSFISRSLDPSPIHVANDVRTVRDLLMVQLHFAIVAWYTTARWFFNFLGLSL